MSELEIEIEALRAVGRFVKGKAPGMSADDAIDRLTRVVTFMRERENDLSALDVKYHDAQNRAEDADMWERRFGLMLERLRDVQRGLLDVPELVRQAEDVADGRVPA